MQKKFKRVLALLLAMLMITATLNVFALDDKAENDEVAAVELAEDTQDEALTEEAIEEDTEDVIEEDSEEAIEAESDVEEAESDVEEAVIDEEEIDGEVSAASLFPIEEIYASIDLSDYLPAELSNIKVSDILDRMVDNYGNPIEIDSNATTVWSNFVDENGEEMYDVWKVAGLNETINIMPRYYYGYYNLQIIIGSGNQFDKNNIRYIVDIQLPYAEDVYKFDVYEQDENGIRTQIKNEMQRSYNITYDDADNRVYVPIIYLEVPSAYNKKIDADYYINMGLNTEIYPGYSISVYEGLYDSPAEAVDAAKNTPEIDITSQITGQKMSEKDAGYKNTWALYSARKNITVVYKKGDTLVAAEKFALYISPNTNDVWFDGLYSSDNNEYVSSSTRSTYKMTNNISEEVITTELKAGYNVNSEYRLKLRAYSGDNKREDSSIVTKAVVGTYSTIEDAKNQTDIKQQLFGNGYKSKYSGNGVHFTVFIGDDVFQISFSVKQGEEKFEDEAPDVGSSDRYFSISSLNDGSGNQYSSYTIPYNGDTYYSMGYQTLLINDADADLSKIRPYAYVADNAKVYYDGVLEEPEKLYEYSTCGLLSVRDFTQTPGDANRDPQNSVRYTVSAENHIDQKNYWITVVKKEHGPKLFVNGPDEREIFLNDYFDNAHDIFIANIGDEELTGLKVELNATNVKLDEYWTVSENGNTTLDPFTETYHSGGNYHGELFNIGKIRLIPDGEGDISGTLTITADGQEPRVITLKGKAGNPKIDTESLHDAVKYVPYQSIITTNNMHDWNKVKFSLMSGSDLPEGVELFESGELYGVPKETGTFKIRVRAEFSYYQFTQSVATLTLNVLDNTNENVDAQTDEGYEIITRVPNNVSNSDQIFEFEYDYAEHADEFQGFWLDGEKLTPDVDYTVEPGSTKITISSQTMSKTGNGTHTIAGEYRSRSTNEVKKAAQNFTKGSGGSSGGSSSGGYSGGGGGGGGLPSTYKVWFEANGGAWVGSVDVKRGGTVGELPTPVRDGYIFDGWYTDTALTQLFDGGTAINSTTTLYAKWVKACSVWFDTNGGAWLESIEVAAGNTIPQLPTPERTGYTFGGWYKDAGLTQLFDTNEIINDTITLYAKWEVGGDVAPPADASGFADVYVDEWYYPDVDWAYNNKLMVGTSNTMFSPNEFVTGGMVATVLARIANADVNEYAGTSYEDVFEGEWYTPYAKWAKTIGLVENTPFNPPTEISRENMGIIILRYLNYAGAELAPTAEDVVFADENAISEQARESMHTLYTLGIFKGIGENYMDPASFTTRAEFAALMHRVSDYIQK